MHVSRKHAKVTFGPGGLFVEDLGSKNGTMVFGRDGRPKFDGPLRRNIQVEVCDGEVIALAVRTGSNMPHHDGALFRVRIEDR